MTAADIIELIRELGGGPLAVILVAVLYVYWQERKTNNALQEKRISETVSYLTASAEREVAMTTQMHQMTTAIEMLSMRLSGKG